jgi:hypothetical protein
MEREDAVDDRVGRLATLEGELDGAYVAAARGGVEAVLGKVRGDVEAGRWALLLARDGRHRDGRGAQNVGGRAGRRRAGGDDAALDEERKRKGRVSDEGAPSGRSSPEITTQARRTPTRGPATARFHGSISDLISHRILFCIITYTFRLQK